MLSIFVLISRWVGPYSLISSAISLCMSDFFSGPRMSFKCFSHKSRNMLVDFGDHSNRLRLSSLGHATIASSSRNKLRSSSCSEALSSSSSSEERGISLYMICRLSCNASCTVVLWSAETFFFGEQESSENSWSSGRTVDAIDWNARSWLSAWSRCKDKVLVFNCYASEVGACLGFRQIFHVTHCGQIVFLIFMLRRKVLRRSTS